MGVPLAALALRPMPQIEGPLDLQARAAQLKNLQAAQQLLPGQLELQQQQVQAGKMQLDQMVAQNAAYHDALTTDEHGNVGLDEKKLMQLLGQHNAGAAIPQTMEALTKYHQANATLQETQSKIQAAQRDSIGALGSALQSSGYDPRVADLLIQQRLQSSYTPDNEKAQLLQWRSAIAQNPGLLKTFADNAVLQSKEQQQRATTLEAARIRAEGGANAPLTDVQLQQANAQLPQGMQLSPGSTVRSMDFARQMMQMQQTHLDRQASLAATQAQREIANQMAKANLSERQFQDVQRSYQFSQTQLENVAKPVDQLAARVGRIMDTLDQRNPQADALVAPELLTVMAGGQGSGLRMNEAEIARIVGGRSVWENLKGNIQHWSTDPNAARSITPSQDAQIRALVNTVHMKLVEKQAAIDDARGKLAGSNDMMEHRAILQSARKRMTEIDAGGTAAASPTGQGRAVKDQSGKVIGYTTDGKTMIPVGQ